MKLFFLGAALSLLLVASPVTIDTTILSLRSAVAEAGHSDGVLKGVGK